VVAEVGAHVAAGTVLVVLETRAEQAEEEDAA
jgi:urea carboxylase